MSVALKDDDGGVSLRAALKNSERKLSELLWNSGAPIILTSGTLAVGEDFSRFHSAAGLKGMGRRIIETVSPSPFDYRNCSLLYIPKDMPSPNAEDSGDYMDRMAERIATLINATHGHTLVLFTSYAALSEINERLAKKKLPFPVFAARKNEAGTIERFKESGNGVLLATGSLWEGMDFPGDIVSSLIIPRLPFAQPDPLHEAQRNAFLSLQDFIRRIVVPDMQIKLRQGFGRAIRTESDSCVVSILDSRAAPGHRFHEAVRAALPETPMANTLAEVAQFIWANKTDGYFSEQLICSNEERG